MKHKNKHIVGDATFNYYTKEEVYAGNGFYALNSFMIDYRDFDLVVMTDVINNMSLRYSCLRPPGAAGAALVTQTGNIVYGDVRPADGSPTCKELGECMMEDGHCVRTVHAEVRAILNATKNNLPTVGSTLYSILKPCFQCSKVIVAAGVTRIVYAGMAYDEARTTEVLENARQGIELAQLVDSNGNPLIDYTKGE